MMFEPIHAFRAAEYQVKFATCTWERERAHDLRRRVFCEEQGIFAGDDRDAIDARAIPIVALSMLGVVADDVVGTVRIHEEEPGLWWGSRLAVHADYRRVGALGATLIRLAVSSAHAMGCHTFLAHVQVQNEELFRRMHWESLEVVDLHGKPHLRMQADLAHYPPCSSPEAGFHALLRKAA
ncbi:MSMEG_0567/Sll0786 family nitrogen starvation N-acetyltransferase [Rhizobium sp. EC-SD404]|uniref:MSMEG_0567/Sll0786 family nitrogen starvation N-acetyltransferase n=1 Tax=Rhizobium sp. EC-SD404 TaxID=2038389 RepID=UPI0012575F67|nr:MSMEG_0567/Sll0786 family nitrogen starvation N-acetyltransferase [Rhizobium sp. EC-SD404]VVT27570.1 Histone acetyltransferase [Rhizobium sp. EC-SD404]